MTLEDLIRQHPGEYTVGEAAKLIDSTPGAVMLQLSASPTLVRTRDDRIDLRKKGRSGTGLTGALKGRIALLEGLLKKAVLELEQHDFEYQHVTSPKLLAEIRAALEGK